MKKRVLFSLLVLGISSTLAGAAHAAGDPAAGKDKKSMCAGCHGIPEYIVKALQAYKSGDRSFSTMRAIAAGLSDQDMADLAAYYAQAAAK
jgi:cytochrome c553